MQNSGQKRFFVRFFILLLLGLGLPTLFAAHAIAQAPIDPPALYATWTTDPTTTISILWNTRDNIPTEADHPSVLEYRVKDHSSNWQQAKATRSPFPFSNRTIHRADLKGLAPGTEYSFRLDAAARIYSFRTMPARLSREIYFAAGGDTTSGAQFEKTNRIAMKYDLDFVLIGGDLAYENGKPERVERVYDWLSAAKRTLITPEGRVVPILVAIGNHEVNNEVRKKKDSAITDQAPYFYALFPFPGVPGYNVLDFSNYLSIISLDTDHTAPIAGEQTAWLEKTLQARQNVPHIFPIYHVPMYPSFRKFSEDSPQRVNWEPLFNKYGVRIVFENHDHTYKRTYPLRNGKVVEDGAGIIYIGDGAWGKLRRGVDADRWYLAKALSVNHFTLVTLRDNEQGVDQQFEMFDGEGNLIDAYPALQPE